jgi:hypothetical protein
VRCDVAEHPREEVLWRLVGWVVSCLIALLLIHIVAFRVRPRRGAKDALDVVVPVVLGSLVIVPALAGIAHRSWRLAVALVVIWPFVAVLAGMVILEALV